MGVVAAQNIVTVIKGEPFDPVNLVSVCPTETLRQRNESPARGNMEEEENEVRMV
jgi:hypothetical protein